ncbi:MAG: hypothetical protein ACJ780_31550 [Solirubrobacteraceae bacterium]|jgi:hypothetical protein
MSSAEQAHDAHANNAASRREAMFERYAELIEIGETPLIACERLGVKPRNLQRTAYRWGRYDIATPLAAYVGQDRKR